MTDVIYTGIEIRRIEDVQLRDPRVRLEFDLWFRHRGQRTVDDIVFLNATEDISLGEPVESRQVDGVQYLRYRVTGVFQSGDVLARSRRRPVEVRFRHRTLPQDRLVYVNDVDGLSPRMRDGDFTQAQGDRILDPGSGWELAGALQFTDTWVDGTLGRPRYLGQSESLVSYSRYTSRLELERGNLSLRGDMPRRLADWIWPLSAALLVALAVPGIARLAAPYALPVFLLRLLLWGFLLVAAEVWLTDLVRAEVSPAVRETIHQIFDALWFLIPAYMLNNALTPLFWGSRLPVSWPVPG